MQAKKDRVIAIDYFRGICILLILLSHSKEFSGPFAYLSGRGSPWVSAAEIFFLLSGITFGIIRGRHILTDFRGILKKSWKRARDLYVLHVLVVLISLALATLIATSPSIHFAHNGVAPTATGFSLLTQIFNLSYSFGWANFLMFYAVFLLIAPFALYLLRTRYWVLVPLASGLLFIFSARYPFHHISVGAYERFFIWQFYFFAGLSLARFRLAIISGFYGLKLRTRKIISTAIIASAAVVLSLSILVNFKFYPVVRELVNEGWLPLKVKYAYLDLLHQKSTIKLWLMENRTGLLRPLAAFLFIAAAYLIYQKYKEPILRRTGALVNALVSDT
jgi:hypothetical protein